MCPMRILLSEGSSLSAREAVTVLGMAGHHLELVSNDPRCMSSFSRFVKRVHIVPAPGLDPDGYLEAVLRIAQERRIDVLLPVNEQAYLFSAARGRLPAGLAVALADFAAFERVQSKAALSVLLNELDVPQPPTRILHGPQELPADQAFPFFAKTAYGTASSGVWRIADRAAWQEKLPLFGERNLFADGLVVQMPAIGQLHRTQSVFDRGRLVGIHAYRQLVEGTGGGDVLKLSVKPTAAPLVERIGAALRWHGALSFDYIVETHSGRPLFIDANPRLVEPVNALLCGVDLAGALVQISLGQSPPRQPEGKPDVKTRLGLMAVLNAAWRLDTRAAVLSELTRMLARTGRFADTVEELTPIRRDYWSAVPFLAVTAAMLISPRLWTRFSGTTIGNYSLTRKSIDRLKQWAAQV